MLSRIRWAIAPLVAAGLLSTAAIAIGQAAAVVEGTVANRTPGGGEVSGLRVLLHQEGAGQGSFPESLTDKEGRFRFQRIELDPSLAYGVSVVYQGAVYGATVQMSEGSPSPTVIDVYDAVDTQESLVLESASVLFAWADKSTRMISVLELVQLANDSDHTFVSGATPMELLRFGLPEGAETLRVETTLPDSRFVQVDVGFALLSNVSPGRYEITYSYTFPYSGGEAGFTRTLRNRLDHLRVLAPAEVMTLSGAGMDGPETVNVGGRPYQLLQTSDRSEGDMISLRLTGLPQPSWRDGLARSFEGCPPGVHGARRPWRADGRSGGLLAVDAGWEEAGRLLAVLGAAAHAKGLEGMGLRGFPAVDRSTRRRASPSPRSRTWSPRGADSASGCPRVRTPGG